MTSADQRLLGGRLGVAVGLEDHRVLLLLSGMCIRLLDIDAEGKPGHAFSRTDSARG